MYLSTLLSCCPGCQRLEISYCVIFLSTQLTRRSWWANMCRMLPGSRLVYQRSILRMFMRKLGPLFWPNAFGKWRALLEYCILVHRCFVFEGSFRADFCSID